MFYSDVVRCKQVNGRDYVMNKSRCATCAPCPTWDTSGHIENAMWPVASRYCERTYRYLDHMDTSFRNSRILKKMWPCPFSPQADIREGVVSGHLPSRCGPMCPFFSANRTREIACKTA